MFLLSKTFHSTKKISEATGHPRTSLVSTYIVPGAPDSEISMWSLSVRSLPSNWLLCTMPGIGDRSKYKVSNRNIKIRFQTQICYSIHKDQYLILSSRGAEAERMGHSTTSFYGKFEWEYWKEGHMRFQAAKLNQPRKGCPAWFPVEIKQMKVLYILELLSKISKTIQNIH